MSRSARMLERALEVIPGGVNSPVRAFGAVGGSPPFINRGEGAELIDEDGHRYLDLVGSWGALLLGHANPSVLGAAMGAAAKGSSFGAPTEGEVLLAEAIVQRVPSIQKVRLVSSGTEATMHAIRLARGFTGRDKIIKLDGCYHGAHDSVLVQAGSGVATFAVPGCAGVPDAVAANTLVAPINDLDAIEDLFRAHGDDIACLILEPVAGNVGCIAPLEGYLQGVRDLCTAHGALLIFDEVMCGFRVHPGGAQALYGVQPDLTTLGKIVGGGYPLAAYGGRRDIMDKLAPLGPVYQAGTLSGNPVAVAAGLATLQLLTPPVYDRLERLGMALEKALQPSLNYHGCSIARVGSMFTVFFRPRKPINYAEVKECDTGAFSKFFLAALNGGVYLPPSQFEAAFLSAALTDAQMVNVIDGVEAALVSALVD
jgi:glutamate-1-semialdehyde 2,1-aminomutase